MLCDIDFYHKQFPPEIEDRLKELYLLIKKILPTAEEKMSYGMPAFFVTEPVCYYAANKHHLGFYPTPGPIEKLKGELKPYHHSKGAIRFPYGQPLPKALIERLIKARMLELQNK